MSENDLLVGKKWVKNGEFFAYNSLTINENVGDKSSGNNFSVQSFGQGISPQFSPLIYLINGGIRIGLFVHLSLLKKSS